MKIKPIKKIRRGYAEEQPNAPGMTLNKLPEKIPRVAHSQKGIAGVQGSGANDGPAQDLPKLLKQKKLHKQSSPNV